MNMANILQGDVSKEKGWTKILSWEWNAPGVFRFFIDHEEDSDPAIYTVEENTTISIKLNEKGFLEMDLDFDCHKATEDEIKEYEKGLL